MIVIRAVAAALVAASLILAPAEAAELPAAIIVHAGKADSPNHGFALQFAEALAQGNNALTIQVEESQGSVQNIIDAMRRGGNYVFTTPPNLIAQARRGEKPFERNSAYRNIRALFPIPSLTMQWVVRGDSEVKRFADLAGKTFVPGAKASFAERQTAAALHFLGLDERVQLIDIDPAGAAAALLGKQVAGVAFAGAFPLPAISNLAKEAPVRLLSLSRGELAKMLAADDSLVAETIPSGTYLGFDESVTSIAQPAGAFATTQMSDATAYAITKAFWTQKTALGERNPAWRSVTAQSLAKLGVKLHRGALRYYREAGIKIPVALK
jgi:TRAP transporter TAXI family solute receptor